MEATLDQPITRLSDAQRVTALLARLRNNEDFRLDNLPPQFPAKASSPAREIAQLARLKRNKSRDRVLLTLINEWFLQRYGELPE